MPPTRSQFLERGVYLAPVLGAHGEELYFSVTRDHRVVRWEFVSDPGQASEILLGLERELDDADPPPRLRLVG